MPEDFLKAVPRSNLTTDICRKMIDHVVNGDWAEGDRIPPERELCQKLGVGRSSLREAMKALEILGMIEMRVGEGTFICPRSDFLSHPLLWAIAGSGVTEADELIEARKLIEVELAGLASVRSTPEDLKQIGVHLDTMETSLGNSDEFLEADIAFHLALGQAGHNRILLNSLHLIRNLMQQWVRTSLGQHAFVAEEALRQHRAIFIAVAKRNPAKAREAMEVHLDAMAAHLRAAKKPYAVEGRDGPISSMSSELNPAVSTPVSPGNTDSQAPESTNPALTGS
ncbi:MAG: FadR family transcriptional regulator [Bryobacterales bacterium]|nr:FadR family transcriptional regulator [Bryobacterales bacterium]